MKLNILNSVRTNNFNDEQLIQKITGLWEEASKHLTDSETTTFGVYHEYESDYKGDYTLSIAIEENNGEGLLEISDKAKYEIFNVDTTKEHGVVRTWKKIWEREDAGTLNRAYTYDFEKYLPGGQVEIHIAVAE
ncbi:GyrI-like domain-containing protein [Oceanobacillus limi]|uniref:GyrI-like domain-containing protein n=1 Tax=Oceanobacillus limi TaxID=930131 RepID=UPI000B833570|nr:effector binding domain-containing protein [Oceanobacillus limi]